MAKHKIDGSFTISDAGKFAACVEYLTNDCNYTFSDDGEYEIEFFHFSDEDLEEIEFFMLRQFDAKKVYV